MQLSWLSQDSNQICLVPNHVLHHHAEDFGIFSKCVIVFKVLRSFTVKKPNCVLMGNFSDLTLEIWGSFLKKKVMPISKMLFWKPNRRIKLMFVVS